jgi:uncharacterized protein DUF4304
MTKSAFASTFDNLQKRLDPLLRDLGFRKSSRTYNRTTADGLTHVIDFQMGRFDPPGTTHIPGLRKNLYGLFAVNLGVYVPEVARHHGGGEPKSVVRDANCCIRTRLTHGTQTQSWWKITDDDALVIELRQRLQNAAFPLFQRFENRDQILNEFQTASDNTDLMATPRIVCAIILLNRGEREQARELLAAQARDQTRHPGHPAYVMDLARRLGIEIAP